MRVAQALGGAGEPGRAISCDRSIAAEERWRQGDWTYRKEMIAL